MNEHLAIEQRALTVAQYNSLVNGLVGTEPVLVEGEVSNSREIPGRNFRYFDIKDRQAVAKCFQGFWNSSKVELENGMLIRVLGYPSLQRNGSFVIDIREIYLVGKGDLMAAYLKLKAKLEKEGLFDPANKQELPRFPSSVGLIAGKNSSAYHDVTAELSERWLGAKIYFHPAKVQGNYSINEVKKAIRHFNTKNPVDVLIIARGGGSMEELQAFDSEEVVREIFASKIPTISAIGHEDHWTLSDLVADQRAKTPTKSAEIAVPSASEVSERLEYLLEHPRRILARKIKTNADLANFLLEKSGMLFCGSVRNAQQNLERLNINAKQAMFRLVAAKIEWLGGRTQTLKLLNPRLVLERGYAVIESGGQRIKSINQIKIGSEFAATLHDGKFEGTINHKQPNNERSQAKK